MVPTEPTVRRTVLEKKREGKDIFGNVPFIFEKPPENGAYKPVVIVHDKETNICSVFEGTVCKVDKIAEQFKEKQAKCIDLCAGIKREHRSTSVYQYGFDFLGGHLEQLRTLNRFTEVPGS